MATFKYTAMDTAGDQVTGVLQGDTRSEILVWLREKSFTPISLEEISVAAEKKKGRRRFRVRSHDMASFCWQLNTMIDGGVIITDAIDTICEDIDNLKFQQVLLDVSNKMKAGASFHESLEEHPKIFSNFFQAMINAGESSGTLSKVLGRLADYYDRRDELNRKVKKAIAYPAFVVGFVILVIIAMMVLIIPRFLEIFKNFGSKLPAFTAGFMAVYNFTLHNAHFIALGSVAFVVLIVAYNRTAMGHRHLSRLALRMPLMGKIIRYSFVAIFGRSMATLLSAGVSVLNAMEILEGMTGNDIIKDVIGKSREKISEGVGIALSMSGNRIFPRLMVKMTQVGEESGSLPQVFDRSSTFYEKQVDATVMTMISILEPAMIVIVGGIVLVVLLALYMPIFAMSEGAGGGPGGGG
jgi:type II secretory pathway component PulF